MVRLFIKIYLYITEGTLPDRSGLSTPISFTAGIDYQTISVNLDGRQAVDNAVLKNEA